MTQDSFTSLKSFNTFNDMDVINKIQQSTIMFFDWGFINKGAFTNVLLNQLDINTNNQSILRKVKDTNYSEGQVWESFHHNFVWESGLATTQQPIHISGVYINGSFKRPTDTGYEHYIDYPKGRVIFNNPISATDVRLEYSYKNILFDTIALYPEIQTMQNEVFGFNNFNQYSSGDYVVLNRKQMPLVAIEATPSISYYPVSLGTGASWVETDLLFHIFDTDVSTVHKLLSFISAQKEKTIYMLDFDNILASGAYPLDCRGTLTDNPKTFADLVNGGYRHQQLYFKDCRAQMQQMIGGNIHYGTVRFTTETISVV